MTAEAMTRIFVAQRTELGDRAMNAIARENVSPFNAHWEIEGRVLESLERQAAEFREIVAGLFVEAVAS